MKVRQNYNVFFLCIGFAVFLMLFVFGGCSKKDAVDSSSDGSFKNSSKFSSAYSDEELQDILKEYLGDASALDLPIDVWD